MTNPNNAAQAATKEIREGFELTYAADADDPACASDLSHFTNGWQACIASQVTSLASLAYRYAMTLSFVTRHADSDQVEGIARRVTAKLKDEIHAIISGQSGSSS